MTAHVIAACRTAVAPRGGAFSDLEPHALAAPVIAQLLRQTGLDAEQVDEIIVSNALGMGGNPARLIALAAGLPQRIAGLSIDRQCAGGMDALLLARQMILSGQADVVIAGGVESYSRRPLRMRTFIDGRPPEPYNQAPFTPWPERDPNMAEAAAELGLLQRISREEQDVWACQSHAKALNSSALPEELCVVEGQIADPFTRALTPALCKRAKRIAGDVTMANTAVAADAAAFCIIVSPTIAHKLERPSLRITGGVTLGSDPTCPGLAPVAAIAETLRRANLKTGAITTAEIMEAYAVQAIACIQGACLDPAIVNRGGGALARGHPIGASGTICVVRLYHELIRHGGTGLAAIAAAGGIATALVLSA